MAYKFDWTGFTEENYNCMNEIREDYTVGIYDFYYVGFVCVGDLCFELNLRADDGIFCLDYDLYVGGIDDGYGYGMNDYPYTYADGGALMVPPSYKEFKSSAEKVFTEYINDYGLYDLPEKASIPLHIW